MHTLYIIYDGTSRNLWRRWSDGASDFENRLERKWTNEMHLLRRKAYLQTSLNVTRVIFQLRKMSFISVRARSMPKYFNHEALFSGKHKENPFHKTKNPQVGSGHKSVIILIIAFT